MSTSRVSNLGIQNRQLVQDIEKLLDESLESMRNAGKQAVKPTMTDEEKGDILHSLDEMIKENKRFEEYARNAINDDLPIKKEKK